ncbi:MAG TPA: hypothetical protein VJJ02_03085, partial [Candidatus Paceibacterota bacterium]
ASPLAVLIGASTTLSWSSTNATGCSSSDGWSGAKALSGDEIISAITATTTFTLLCENSYNSASTSVTVTLTDTPLPPYASIPAGVWYEIANTSIATMFPTYSQTVWGTSGPGSVVNAWSGGAFDAVRNVLYVFGGGHAAYGGNEVYAFYLDEARWERMTNPSPLEPCGGALSWNWPTVCPDYSTTTPATYYTTDGTPLSPHSYDMLEWIPSINRLFVNATANYPYGSNNDNFAWFFDPVAKTWEQLANPPRQYTYDIWAASAYDAVRDLVYLPKFGFITFNPATRTYSYSVPPGTSSYSYGSGDYDSTNKVLVRLRSNNAVDIYDLADLGNITKQEVAFSSISSPKPNLALHRYGVAYHPVSDRFVLWGGDRSVWTFDYRTKTFAEYPNLTGPTPPTSTSSGVFGRWRYVPAYDVFMGFDAATNVSSSNVWLYKLPAQ